MEYFKFNCGCSYPIIKKTENGHMPLLDFDIERDLVEDNLSCPATWELLTKGQVKGVFQLESPLGKRWCTELKPKNVEDICALGAILRPGCTKSFAEDGKSMTDHFCRRQNNVEPVEIKYECLKPILGPTNNILVYQEQSLKIAQVVAGFNLQEADSLRKAIGKKLPEEMAKLKLQFVDGAKKVGLVSENEALEIFGWIEKSQRYSFNKAHSMAYGIQGYISAYLKVHFPLGFYAGWLRHAQDSPDMQKEIEALVEDGKLMDISIEPPTILHIKSHFSVTNLKVVFGFTDVRNIGRSGFKKIKEIIFNAENLLNKKLKDFTRYEFINTVLIKFPAKIAETLIHSGALRHFDSCRAKLAQEYSLFSELSPTEKLFINEKWKQFDSVTALLSAAADLKNDGGACHSKKRLKIVTDLVKLYKNPPSPVIDTASSIITQEKYLLGINLTRFKLEDYDTSFATITCKEYITGKRGMMIFCVEIKSVKATKIKNGESRGRMMAFIDISDNTCTIPALVFADTYEQSKDLLVEGNLVYMQCAENYKRSGLIVNKIWTV